MIRYVVRLCAHHISDVFAAVQASATYGIVPFENSSHGSVVTTLDLLVDHDLEYRDVVVCGEVYLPVCHCLLGRAGGTLENDEILTSGVTTTLSASQNVKARKGQPLVDLSGITRVLSHAQAFGQCDVFLSTFLKGVECQEVSSTSKAAEIVESDLQGTSAAICSSLAAEIHSLELLAEGIQDQGNNTTRFFILRKGYGLNVYDVVEDRPTKWKTLIAFQIDHHSSGALATALLVFTTFNLNLTSINSRPSQLQPWHYVFLVEFEGKKQMNGSGLVNQALEELGKAVMEWRWLGTWIDRIRS